MNKKIYCVIWSETIQAWVVTSELARGKKIKLSKIAVVAAIASSTLVVVSPVNANCISTTTSVVCDASNPNPYTSSIGSASTVNGFSVVLSTGSQLNIGDATGIALGNNGIITLEDGSTLKNAGRQSYGSYGAGANTIEFGYGNTLTIGVGASVTAAGPAGNSEAINAMGDGNTLINKGTIRGGASSAIYFENSGAMIGHGRNRIDNFGTIIAGANGEALGSYGNVGIDFINRPGATVQGNLNFQGGNDTIVLGNNSTFSGNLNGGGGTNTLRLDAEAGSSDILSGQLKNFTLINKTGLGIWTLRGALGPNDRTGRATVDVQAGTLTLGANYNYFTGTTVVGNGGTLRGQGEHFPQNIDNNGRVLFDQVTDAAYGGVISGTGMVIKSGSGALELTGNNTHIGGTNVAAGTLALSSAGTLGASTGATTVSGGTLELGGSSQTQAALNQLGGIVQGGTLNLGTYQLSGGTLAADSTVNASGLFDFRSGTANGVLRGAAMQKTTAGSVTVAGTGSQVASAEVKDGTLRFEQAGAFTTTGNYTTQAGATTDLGRDYSTLAVGGVFTQAANATLKVTLDATRPMIKADSARLDGRFTFDGFSPNATLPAKASEVTQRFYTLIQTTNGVTGDFTNSQNAQTDLDYLLRGGHISADGKDYNLGFRMAWNDGGQAQGTGDFTVKDDTAFQMDTVLADQSAPAGGFSSGWDGKSLSKTGGGLLVLSAANTYTGGTTIGAGTLALSGAGTLGASTGTTTVSGGALDLGGTTQTQAALNQFGGTVQGGTLNLGTYLLGGGTLAADSTVNASSLFDFRSGTANGVLRGAAVQKTTAGSVTVAGTGSQVASVEVQDGTLRFEQADAFTTTGNYTTQAGATTNLGQDQSTLVVGGVFTQAANATLKVTLDATRPVIKADSANLDGLFTFDGFSPNATSPAKASEVTQRVYTLITTTNGVTGDFTNSQNAQTDLDYLLRDGHISADGKDYNLGFRMAWNDGGQAQGTGDFTIKDDTAFQMDTVLADQSAPAGGFASGWDGKSLSKLGGGLLVLSEANTYTGSTTLNGGTLRTDVADSFASSSDVIVNDGVLDLYSNDQVANRLAGTGGEIRLNGATLTANNATTADNTTFGGDITDGTKAGSLIKTGDGTLTLTGQTGWTGITELRAGQLVLDGIDGGAQLSSNIVGTRGTRLILQNGASLTGWIDPTDVKIDATSIWRMTDSSLVDNVDLAGAIQFVKPTTLPLSESRTLTASNWVGQGGTVELYTVLGDDRSVSDRIVIDGGRATGTTGLVIRHAGGNGAQTDAGIRVVETRNGATTETDAFSLSPTSDGYRAGTETIAAGAYDYSLVRGGNNGVADDWYLSSMDCGNDRSLCEQPDTPMPSHMPSQKLRPEVGSYLNNKDAASTMLIHTLHDRQLSAQNDDRNTSSDANGWLRVVNKSSDRTGAGRQDLSDTISLIHGGGDLLHFSDGADGSIRVGAMGAYGTSDNRTDNGSLSSHGSVNGYSVGVYGTWFGHQDSRSGPYVDSWLMYGKFDNQVKGQGLASEDYRSSNLLASLETGYSIAIHESKDTKLYIEPQAQVINSKYRANSHTEHTGTVVSGEVDTALTTRLGVRLHGDLGGVSGIEPIAEVSWWHGPSSQAIEFDGMKVHDALPEDRLEGKVGLQGNLSNAVSVWGQVGIESGEHDYTASKFQLGVKYAW